MAKADRVEDALGQAVEDIGAYIRKQREGAQVSLRQLAKVAGISNPDLSQIERGLRKPSAEILAQIATGLRISAEALYVRAGILEPRVASPVLDALAGDAELSERQKQVLTDIYESFRRENHAAGARSAPPAAPGTDAPGTDAPGTDAADPGAAGGEAAAGEPAGTPPEPVPGPVTEPVADPVADPAAARAVAAARTAASS